MRAGWENKSLKVICSVYGRIGFRGYTKADFVSSPDDGAITLSPSNIISGELRCDKCSYVSWEKYYQSPEIMIFPGDILLVKTASIGKCALVRSLPHETTINPQFVVLKEIKANHQYLTYFLQSPIAQKKFQEFAIGAAVPTFSQKKLEGLVVPIPSLSEQQRIVDILDQEFAKVDALKANAEKSLQAAKDLFQATLKMELEPKEGWQRKRLEEICQITAELINPTLPEYINQIHIGGANIVAETGVLIDLKTSREENLISGKFPFDETMVLYSKIRPYLKKVCCPDFQGICSADIYPLKPNQDVDRTFLYYILLSQDFTDYAILGSARAGMPKVNRPYMFAYTCSIPEYEEQRKIANRLDAVREQTNALQDNYQKTLTLCDDLKQSLLRKAFNGEL